MVSTIESLLHLWVTWISLSQELVLVISDLFPEPYKRVDNSYTDFLMSLVVNGYSEFSLLNTLKNLNLPYSDDELNKIKNDLKIELNLFKQRELPESAFELLIVAYYCEIKDSSKVEKAVGYYIVFGIDMEGKKDIYGLYTSFGKENRADWNKVFEDLINRGLKRVLVVISDDFPGIIQTIKAVYPYADHHLCFVHLQRNVRKYMTRTDASELNKDLAKIKFVSSFDENVQKFYDFCARFKEKYGRYMSLLMEKAEHYMVFTKYPEPLRKHIYTT